MVGDRRRRTVAAGWVVALLLLVTGCATGPAARIADQVPAPGATLTGVLDGQRVRLDMATSQHTVGLAVWFHGQRGDVDSYMGSGWLDSIRSQGWAVASSDLHGASWGDPEAVQDARELVRWATEHAHADVGLLVAGSMGGLASLNALIDGAVSSPCWFGTEAVVDVTSVSAVPESTAEIQRVYGGPPPELEPGHPARPAAALDEVLRGLVPCRHLGAAIGQHRPDGGGAPGAWSGRGHRGRRRPARRPVALPDRGSRRLRGELPRALRAPRRAAQRRTASR